jgi:predicted nucleotidyltransferase
LISLKSKITKEILNYFFINPEESLYVNELARKLGLDKRNLVKKTKELETEGILKCAQRGNLKFYSINTSYALYEEIKNIILKTFGFEHRLRTALAAVKGLDKAFIYGSYAKNKMAAHSDIDLLVVGKHSAIDLQKKITVLQKEINREINVVDMDRDEFEKRSRSKDPFIGKILKEKHIKIV